MQFDKYYSILEVDKEVSLAELKRSYRRKVKQFHPDVSMQPDAQNKFVELTEAYEFILARILDKMNKPFMTESENDLIIWDNSRQEWMREQMAKLRQKAREEARKKFEEYRNSPAYKITNALSRGSDIVVFILGLLIIVAAITGAYQQYKTVLFSVTTVIAAICMVLIGSIMSIYSLKKTKKTKRTAR
jgi:hypothetical protein